MIQSIDEIETEDVVEEVALAEATVSEVFDAPEPFATAPDVGFVTEPPVIVESNSQGDEQTEATLVAPAEEPAVNEHAGDEVPEDLPSTIIVQRDETEVMSIVLEDDTPTQRAAKSVREEDNQTKSSVEPLSANQAGEQDLPTVSFETVQRAHITAPEPVPFTDASVVSAEVSNASADDTDRQSAQISSDSIDATLVETPTSQAAETTEVVENTEEISLDSALQESQRLAVELTQEAQVPDIQITQIDGEIILSAHEPNLQTQDDETSPELIPITTMEGLEQAILTAENLSLPDAAADGVHEAELGEVIHTEASPVVILISAEMAQQIEDLLQDAPASAEPQHTAHDIIDVPLAIEGFSPEAPFITSVIDTDSVIIGARNEVPETENLDSHAEITPITTVSQLQEAFTYIESLQSAIDMPLPDEILSETTENTLPRNVEIVMSEEMMTFIEEVRAVLPPLEPANESEDTDHTDDSLITFSTQDGTNHISFTQAEFLQIRQFIVDQLTQTPEEQSIPTLSELPVLSADGEIVVPTHSDEAISELSKEELTTVFATETHVDNSEMQEFQNAEKKEEISSNPLLILRAEDKEIRIDADTLRKLLEKQKIKTEPVRHILFAPHEQAPEEVTPNFVSVQGGNTIPASLSYQLVLYLLALTDLSISNYEASYFYPIYSHAA